jgi:hypothetical protein
MLVIVPWEKHSAGRTLRPSITVRDEYAVMKIEPICTGPCGRYGFTARLGFRNGFIK